MLQPQLYPFTMMLSYKVTHTDNHKQHIVGCHWGELMIITGKRLDCVTFSSLKVTYINIEIHWFTESSPMFLIQRPASHDHQSLPLETEGHLMQSPHNWILEADVKPMNKQCYINYSILSPIWWMWYLVTSACLYYLLCIIVSIYLPFCQIGFVVMS